MKARQASGMALIIVLIILFSLVVVAAPFVASMIFQERTSYQLLSQQEATIGAQSALNYGIFYSLNTHDAYERQLRTYGPASYLYDTWAELQVKMPQNLQVTNPKGMLWGFVVEDEQGKISLSTAPRNVLLNAIRVAENLRVDPKNFTTVYAVRPRRWVCPARIRGWSPDNAGVRVDQNFMAFYGPGTKIRITSPSLGQPFYCESQGVQVNPADNQPYITLQPTPGMADNLVIELEERAPININTASREALACMFAGLRVNVPVAQGATTNIDDPTAMAVAGEVMRRARQQPFVSVTDFAIFIEGIKALSDQQKQAVIINALMPTAQVLDGTGTVPICFTSFDVLTIQSSCSINHASTGTQTAVKHFRDVVEITPPIPVNFKVESQIDFDSYHTHALGFSGTFEGYPFGSKLASFPHMLPNPPDIALKPNQSWIQMKPSIDERGQVAVVQGEQEPFLKRQHFSDTQEGRELKGASYDPPLADVFPMNHDSNAYADITAGGCMFWIRFDGSAPAAANLFNIREADYVNRISLEMNNGELILSVTDETINPGGIGNGLSQVRMPFSPVADVWYHIGMFWKGTRYGHLALMVDGFGNSASVQEHVNTNNTRICTKLAADLPAPDPNNPNPTPLSLQDDAWIPDPAIPGQLTPLEIGSEVVLYDKVSKTCVRSARGTQGYAHPAGVQVSIFGYTSLVFGTTVDPTQIGAGDVPPGHRVNLDRLPTGSTTLASGFSADTRRRLAKTLDAAELNVPAVTAQFFANPNPTAAAQEFTQIQQDFPQKGYVRIGNELIKYDGFTTAQVRIPENDPNARPINVPAFRGVSRAGLGTTAAPHNQGANIRLSSVHVAGNARIPEGFIQIDSEWVGPVVRDPGDGSLFVVPTTDANAHTLNRGVGGTGIGQHNSGAPVMPIFAVRAQGTGRSNVGRYDSITVTNAAMERFAANVRRVVGYTGNIQLVGLFEESPRDYLPDNKFTRVLKFPSGELICRPFMQTGPPVTIGPVNGTIDEVITFAAPKSPEWRVQNVIQAADASPAVGVGGGGGMDRFGGVIKVGEEFIGYAEMNQGMLTRTVRGYLNSPVQVHDRGDLLFNFSFLPVSSLNGSLDDKGAAVQMRENLKVGGRDGYVLIDNEVLFYTSRSGNTVRMPSRLRNSDGLYRGMFGTAPSPHNDYALVYAIPYRYYDTYKAQEFDPTMAYFQVATSVPNAHWNNVRWLDQRVDPNLTAVHALARVDRRKHFWDPPDGQWLVEFTDGGSGNRMNVHGTKKEDASLEIRFYFEYKSGSFYPNNAWKTTPKILDIQAQYERPWRILHHEEK